MKTISIPAFDFAELSPKAQRRVLDSIRQTEPDADWYVDTLNDVSRIAAMLGIRIDRDSKSKSLNIQFSGFWSQGDGASFTGRYAHHPSAPTEIREYAPKDAALHRIADQLNELQKANATTIKATISRNHHVRYVHENSVDISVTRGDDDEPVSAHIDAQLCDLLRDFMRWIYKQLETEYESLTSDERLAEIIDANEMVFSVTGENLTRFAH